VLAKVVIGADGANSLVRRRLSRPFQRSELSMATGYFAHGVSSQEIAIHLVANPPGYIWSFPRPSHLAIGICAQADAAVTAAALRDQALAWMSATAIARGAVLKPYSWPIPSLTPPGLEQLELSGDRWSLVGDAAGLVDPITREGIYFALLSGAWSADAVAGQTARTAYESRVREEILTELARAARLKATFFQPSFGSLLIHALDRSAAITAVMEDLIAGRQSYRGLKWRLLRTLEARLMWRALVDSKRWYNSSIFSSKKKQE
jgi:flavin-dependent dehydrogenase